MKTITHLSLTQYLLIGALIFVTTVTAVFGYHALSSVVQFNQTWEQHNRNTQAKEAVLTQIRHNLGYGGFIHHFKNFVLRQEETYLTQLKQSQLELMQAIQRFEEFTLTSSELEAITKLKMVINQYSDNIPLAIQGKHKKWPSAKTDQLVKVDDQPALDALKALETAWLKQYNLDYQSFKDNYTASQHFKNYTFTAFVLLISFIIATNWFFHRLVVESNARKKLEQELLLSKVAIDHSSSAVSISDDQGNIIFTNPAFSSITGYHSNEIIGENHTILSSGHHHDDFYKELWRVVDDKGKWEGEVWTHRKNGDVYPKWLSIIKLPSEHTEIGRYVSIFSDISEQKALEAKTYQATHDSLTKLPNRRLFFDRLNTAMLESKRSQSTLVVLFLDLDLFKPINDTYGHAVGDKVLIEVAHRINANLRETDTVCRFGGDEFVVLLTNLKNEQHWYKIAQQLQSAIRQSYFINNKILSLDVSIGEASFHYSDDIVTPENLIDQADKVMYDIKTQKQAE